LVLVARQHNLLTQLADELRDSCQVEVIVIVKDLSKIEEVRTLYQEVRQLNLDIEFLVNSAGIGDYGLFIKTDWEKELAMLNVNVVALTYLTKMFAQDMVERGTGKILNMGSIASFLPGPLMAVYYSTKGYVLRLGLALSEELRGTGVTVTTLCPGPTESRFQQVANMEQSKVIKNRDLPTAKEVAEFGYQGMLKGKTYLVHGLLNHFYVFLTKVVPLNFHARIVRQVQGLATD
jgi:short-subunit dehydrogenase